MDELNFYKETMVRIAKAVNISDPIVLIANAEGNETYADVLIRLIEEMVKIGDKAQENLEGSVRILKKLKEQEGPKRKYHDCYDNGLELCAWCECDEFLGALK